MERSISKWKGRLLLGCLAMTVLLGTLMGVSGCVSLRMSDSEIEEHFRERGQEVPRFFEHRDDVGSIFVARTGTGPGVVFVHGSPGSWTDFVQMFSDSGFNSAFSITGVDRPGFGASKPKVAEPSLEVQAERIVSAVRASGAPLPAIWVGHSLGGPVVSRLAADYPDAVAGLVLVAPSMDPELEKRRWYNWLAAFPLIRWGLSHEWRNSNDEIFPHKAQLERLREKLGSVSSPTIVIQGDQDTLVPLGNAHYVARELPSGVVELRILEGVNHFIPWSHPEAIKEAVLSLREQVFDAKR